MHSSLNQELARARHDDLLRRATRARVEAIEPVREPEPRRRPRLALVVQHVRTRRPAPA